jgi:hypothetical protein
MLAGALVVVARRILLRVFFVCRVRMSVRVNETVVGVGMNMMEVPV